MALGSSYRRVAHAWAHQTGKNRSSNRVWYDGETIYSYGRHFPIARLLNAPDGERVVLFTTAQHSSSTSHHKGVVKDACSHLKTFRVPDPSREPSVADFEAMLRSAKEDTNKAARAIKLSDEYLLKAKAWIDEANDFNRVFKLGLPVAALTDLDILLEDVATRIERGKAAERRREARRARIAAQKDRKRLRDWLGGASITPPHTAKPFVHVKGDRVETTWSASVPLKDALRVYDVAKAMKLGKRKPRMPKIGDFGRAEIDRRGTIRVACHIIPFRYAKIAARIAGIDP